jgi:phosphoserine phosphatase RsbU/P
MTQSSNLNNINPEHLLTLFEITRTMISSLDFDEVLNTVMDSVMQVTRAQRGFLMIADEAGQLQVRVARNIDGGKLADEASYSTTIVNQVVSTREPLLTNNAQYDDRYKAGQSIIMRGLRAILCAPMLAKGRVIGVVYVDSSLKHGMFSESDLQLLKLVAGQAGVAIENARLYQVAVEKGRLDRELQMAREIQESLLPRKLPALHGYQVAARWRSAREVAGDFYDVFRLADGRMGLVIADVSDKGAPAALFMAATRSMIRSHAFAGLSPLETLGRTNDLTVEDAENGMFVTTYYSVYEAGGTSVHVNAGHNPPLLYRCAERQVHVMPRGGLAIGWFSNNPMQPVELQLAPGDVMVYYTDGLTEAENEQGDYFGEGRLIQAILDAAEYGAQDILNYIVDQVDAFCGNVPAFDDLTLCVVRYTGD